MSQGSASQDTYRLNAARAKNSKEIRRFRRIFIPKMHKKIAAASFDMLPEYPPSEKAELLSTIDARKVILTTIRNHKGSFVNCL